MATLVELQAQRNQLLADIGRTQRLIASTQNAIDLAQRNLANATDPAQQSQYQDSITTLNQLLTGYKVQLEGFQTQLAQVNNEIQNFQPQPTARQSTSDTVREAQAANANGADTQNPGIGPQAISVNGRVTPQTVAQQTNAQKFVANNDTNVEDAPLVTINNSQSTPGRTAFPGSIPPNTQSTFAAQTPGTGSGNDDTPRANATRAAVESIFGSNTPAGQIDPQANVLAKYANYTYNISIYMMSQQQFVKMLQTRSKDISGFQLLMRSGGIGPSGGAAPNNQVIANVEDAALGGTGNATGPAQTQLGRNQFFPLDYYLDDVRIETLVQGKGTGGAHNAVSLSFNIIEPNGISLFDNLYQAAQQYNSTDSGIANGQQSYTAQHYLMVIKFYGYDENGNLARPQSNDIAVSGTDPNAVVEKFIPFQFTNITFRIANRLTEYSCQCVCPQFNIGYSQGRGTIPYNVEISSQTLQELFAGNLNFVTPAQTGNTATDGRQGQQADIRRVDNAIAAGQSPTTVTAGSSSQQPAPPKANAAATPVFSTGLMAALNKFAQELVDKGFFTYPDTYEIVFPQGAEIIANAKVVPPGGVNKQATAFNSKAGATAADLKDPVKSTPNTNSKTTNATAGMSIVQFLDQYTRTSTYIYDQQTKIVDPNNPNGPPIAQGSPTGVTAWYHIDVEARPKQYDPKRNDFAYHIIYRITPFKINDLRSDWFPLGRYQGTHKVYNYWFTGQNSDILDLELDFNYLYYLVMSGGQSELTSVETGNYREYIKKIFQPASNQSSQGIVNSKVNEPSANAADSLYSPADLNVIKLKILGDPAWLQQGELWQGVAGMQMNYDAFLPDGTINYAAQEALFEVLFNKPVDYDLGTGLQDPGQKNYGANRSDGKPGSATQSYIFRARQIINYFSRGRFEQELDGTLVRYPIATDQAKEQKQRVLSNVEDATLNSSETRTGTKPVSVLRQTPGPAVPSALNTAINNVLSGTPAYQVSLTPQIIPSDDAVSNKTLPASPAQPPTSGTQVVGPAASTPINSSGVSGTTAFGTALGIPTVQVPTTSGQVITVSSQSELSTLLNSRRIDINTYNTASATLAVRQQQANNPVNNFPAQQLKKDNG